MILRNKPKLEDFLKICSDFSIEINEDLLFEEYVELSEFYENLPTNVIDMPIDKQWVFFFQNHVAANFEKIASVVFAIPHSNAMSERIFSLMTHAWRKERNRLNIKTLEAELMVKHNFTESCIEFATYLKRDGDDILKNAKSGGKYE